MAIEAIEAIDHTKAGVRVQINKEVVSALKDGAKTTADVARKMGIPVSDNAQVSAIQTHIDELMSFDLVTITPAGYAWAN